MDVFEKIEHYRKAALDWVLPDLRIAANDITRAGGWLCFLASLAILRRSVLLAVVLLAGGLSLDGIDGSLARRQGQSRPEVDWATDRFSEFSLCAAYFYSYPGWVASVFLILYAINVFLPFRWVPSAPLRAVRLGALLTRLYAPSWALPF
jgi:phosphatidylglycerophosphate synthase